MTTTTLKPNDYFRLPWGESMYRVDPNGSSASLVCDHAGDQCAPELPLDDLHEVIILSEDEVSSHRKDDLYKGE